MKVLVFMVSENHYMFIINYAEKNILFQVLNWMILAHKRNKENTAFKVSYIFILGDPRK